MSGDFKQRVSSSYYVPTVENIKELNRFSSQLQKAEGETLNPSIKLSI